jgi:hypothetical protein
MDRAAVMVAFAFLVVARCAMDDATGVPKLIDVGELAAEIYAAFAEQCPPGYIEDHVHGWPVTIDGIFDLEIIAAKILIRLSR